MKKERTVILRTGTYFKGTHSPNWQDFDIIIKVTDVGNNLHVDVGDVVKIPRNSIDFDIIKKTPANIKK